MWVAVLSVAAIVLVFFTVVGAMLYLFETVVTNGQRLKAVFQAGLIVFGTMAFLAGEPIVMFLVVLLILILASV